MDTNETPLPPKKNPLLLTSLHLLTIYVHTFNTFIELDSGQLFPACLPHQTKLSEFSVLVTPGPSLAFDKHEV